MVINRGKRRRALELLLFIVAIWIAGSGAQVIPAPTTQVILQSMIAAGEAQSYIYGPDNVTLVDIYYMYNTTLTMTAPQGAFSFSTSFITPLYTWGAGLFISGYTFVYKSIDRAKGSIVVNNGANQICTVPYTYNNETVLTLMGNYVSNSSILFYYQTQGAAQWTLLCSATATASVTQIGLWSFTQLITFNYFNISSVTCTVPNTRVNAANFNCVCRSGYSGNAASSCSLCGPGEYSTYNAQSCSVCSPGSYSTGGTDYCILCPAGWSAYAGNGSCFPCPAGTISQYSWPSCVECFPGSFASNMTSVRCDLCPVNTYANEGSAKCTACASQNSNQQCAWPVTAAKKISAPTWDMIMHDNHNNKYMSGNIHFGCTTEEWIFLQDISAEVEQILSSNSSIFVFIGTAVVALNYDYDILWQYDFATMSAGRVRYQEMVYDEAAALLFIVMATDNSSNPMLVVCMDGQTGDFVWTTTFLSWGDYGFGPFWVLYNAPLALYVYYMENNDIFMQMIYAPTGEGLDWVALTDAFISFRPPLTNILNSTALIIPVSPTRGSASIAAISLQNNYTYLWTTEAQFGQGPILVSSSLVIFMASSSAGPQLAALSLVDGSPVWRQPMSYWADMALNDGQNELYVLNSGSMTIINANTGATISTVTFSGTYQSILAVDNEPSAYLAGASGVARVSLTDGKTMWTFDKDITPYAIVGKQGPLVALQGGFYGFPCIPPPPKEDNKALETLAIVLTVIGGVVTVIQLIIVFKYKHKKEKLKRRMDTVKISYDTISMIGTLVAALIIQIPINQDISHLVNNMANATSFKNSYLENCSPNPNYSYNLTELCVCTSQNTITPGSCSASSCGIQPIECSDLLASLCDCDYSFYEYNCNCKYNPDTSHLTCSIDIDFVYPLTPKTYITKAFDSCHAHYNTVSDLLWATIAIHNGLAFVVSMCAVYAHIYPDKTKVGKIFSTLNTVITTILVSIVAIMTRNYYCQSIPNSGVSDNAAFDTTGQFLPGCKINANYNMEDKLLVVISSCVVILAMKPVQAVLKFLGLLIPHTDYHHI